MDKQQSKNDQNRGRRRRNDRYQREESDLIETIIQVSRVSKKTKGGNQIGFSVLTVVGDGKGKVGVGLGKGPDVASSIKKGFSIAKRNMIEVPIVNTTIPHQLKHKFGAAHIMIKPAAPGTGLIVGGVMRAVMEAAGIQNVVGKILGTNNKINNVYCTHQALGKLKPADAKRI